MAGIYIHIPFCRRKCIYCDFYSIGASADRMHSYVLTLIQELKLRKAELLGESVKTVYIGGGTPSLLPLEDIRILVKALIEECTCNNLDEFTIEVNPDDVSKSYIEGLVEAGVNRISMGIQSLVDDELRVINRRHNSQQALDAVDCIRQSGINNISVDLIYGLPGQTLDTWLYSVNRVMELGVEHISCYSLSYEDGTILYKLRDKGDIKECDEDLCVSMYEHLIKTVTQYGYEHYEISNFAKNGMYSKHNSNYWNGTPYLGLGASAHSYCGNVRSYNVANLKQYLSAINAGELACEREQETEQERYDEYIMIRLRTKWGIDTDAIRNNFGERYYGHFMKVSEQYLSTGKMCADGRRYKLTESGVMLSDMIIRDLMY